ncbi:ROK family protein [Clostridium neuense]|uniref:ROK family protein n=1 Tax=Clostridium neuense TaxID=1728934 RepID=A0ABW8TQP0_9CLOT
MSAPGAVDNETDIIGESSAVSRIHGFNIKKRIKDELGLQVDIENDANCAGLAGVWIGAAKENKDLIFVV